MSGRPWRGSGDRTVAGTRVHRRGRFFRLAVRAAVDDWLAMYLIDIDGFVRYKHFGEGAYEETEAKIRELLAEKDRT